MDFLCLLPCIDSYYFKTLKNTRRWNNTQLLHLLSGIQVPFGEPKMGWIRAFGKDMQVIVYDRSWKENYAYVDARFKIVIGMAPKPGFTGGSPKGYEEPVSADQCSNADAVEILADLIKRLQRGEDLYGLEVEEPVIEVEDEEEEEEENEDENCE